MKILRIFVKNYWFQIGVFLIFALAFLFRFYNYENRWGLAYDQAHSALVAKHAVDYAKFPLLGPFSSGGPFQTGGEWYWIVMAGTVLSPSLIAPWIFLSILTVFSVILMVFLGKELVDMQFGLIAGVFMVVSTAQVSQSTNLTNQTPVIIFSVLAVFAAIRYIKQKKVRYLFLQGLFIGIASTIHIQGVALLPFIFVTFVLGKSQLVKGLSLILLGLVIAWVPVFIADYQNNFYNTLSMVNYFSNSQAQASYEVLGRRWLTFLGVFLPHSWARIIGGYSLFGYIIMIGAGVLGVIRVYKKNLSKEWWVLFISFLLMIIMLRYIRTPLFDSFLIFLHPFVYLITAWFVYSILRNNFFLGLALFLFITFGSTILSLKEILLATNYTAVQANNMRSILKTKFPNKKFSLYDFKNGTTGKSLPLVLFLSESKIIDDDGLRIGVATGGARFNRSVTVAKIADYKLLNLESSTSARLKKEGWELINPNEIYRKTQLWYLDKENEY